MKKKIKTYLNVIKILVKNPKKAKALILGLYIGYKLRTKLWINQK